jgi:hypothetical protein
MTEEEKSHFYDMCAAVVICASPPDPAGANSAPSREPALDQEAPGRQGERRAGFQARIRANWQHWRLLMRLAKSARLADLRRLTTNLLPRSPLRRAAASVRGVVWHDDDFPGFAGTCVLINALGLHCAVTARHVLNGALPAPDNFRVPADQTTGRMRLIEPKAIFWYNAGTYDHVADVAVAILDEPVEGALDALSIGFTTPSPNEGAFIIGYPKATSQVLYDVNNGREHPLLAADGTPVDHIFAWDPVLLGCVCSRSGHVAELGVLESTQPLISLTASVARRCS